MTKDDFLPCWSRTCYRIYSGQATHSQKIWGNYYCTSILWCHEACIYYGTIIYWLFAMYLLQWYSASHIPSILTLALIHYDLPHPGLVDGDFQNPTYHEQGTRLVELHLDRCCPLKLAGRPCYILTLICECMTYLCKSSSTIIVFSVPLAPIFQTSNLHRQYS